MKPCTFFDEASQGTMVKGGVGGIIFLPQNHPYKLKFRVGLATNIYNKFMIFKLVLHLTLAKGVSRIQILGDSILVIQWMNGEFHSSTII